MTWTRYQVFVSPRPSTDFEKNHYGFGSHLVIIDPANRIQIPPQGRVVDISSYEVRKFWEKCEEDGDCFISLPPKPADIAVINEGND